MENTLKKQITAMTLAIIFAAFSFWITWWPLREWLFSFAPSGDWNGVYKIAVLSVMVFSGLWAIPIFFIVVGILSLDRL